MTTAPTQNGRLVAAAHRLLTSSAVRDRANRMLNLALAGQLEHFTVDLLRLDPVCDYVVRVIRSGHADLTVPPHARWRHFEAGEIDRWGTIVSSRAWTDSLALGRSAIDLIFISILLDGLASPGWAYAESATGETYARSEGSAIASLVMFTGGMFSSDPYDPLRADARALAGLTLEELSDGLQVSRSNPLVGLEDRLAMINRLGRYMAEEPALFGVDGGLRPGGLIDHLIRGGADAGIAAPRLVELVLHVLTAIAPGRYALGGVALGDSWPHSRIILGDETDGLVPFHQSALWLTYSLIEPLVWAGFEVFDLDGLVALADVRNGGLLLDLGLLRLRNPGATDLAHLLESELIVEWRALTVALIDKVADGVRRRLGRSSETFPLACVLEGGTFPAGRQIAREKRPDGSAPLTILADVAVF